MRTFLEYDTVSGSVCGILVAASKPPAGHRRGFVDVTGREDDARRATRYDSATDALELPPVLPPPPDYGPAISPVAFALLFTQAEREALRAYVKNNEPLASKVEDFDDLSRRAAEVRLQHPATQAGLSVLVAAGILTEARKTAISSGTVPAEG
jgi:hypothetical protein